jgi:hypothetical protein
MKKLLLSLILGALVTGATPVQAELTKSFGQGRDRGNRGDGRGHANRAGQLQK